MTRHAFSKAQCRAGGAKPDIATRTRVLAVLENHKGSVTAAALELGMSYSKVKGIAYRDRRGARESAEAPAPVPPKLPVVVDSGHRLVEDRRAETVQRRRFDCKHLTQCELAWIEEHGADQGRCPTGCKGYEKEERC